MPGVWLDNLSYSTVQNADQETKLYKINTITRSCSHAVRTLPFQFIEITVWIYTSAVNVVPAIASITGNPRINPIFRDTTDWAFIFAVSKRCLGESLSELLGLEGSKSSILFSPLPS